MESPPETIVFRPAGPWSSRGSTLGGGATLVLVGLLASAATLWGPPIALLGLWYLLTARQQAVLTDRSLTVRGRLTRRSVALETVEQVHEARGHTVWVAAHQQQPFRVYFVPGGEPGPDTPDTRLFVTEVRRRAAALGAGVDVTAAVVAQAPPGTSLLFSL